MSVEEESGPILDQVSGLDEKNLIEPESGPQPSKKDALSPEMEWRVAREWPKIIRRLRTGEPITKILRGMQISYRRMLEFQRKFPERKSEYRDAVEEGIESLVDGLLDIIEKEKDVSRARLKVETIKWLAAVRFPERYAERSKLDVRVQHWDMGKILHAAQRRLTRYREVIDALPAGTGTEASGESSGVQG